MVDLFRSQFPESLQGLIGKPIAGQQGDQQTRDIAFKVNIQLKGMPIQDSRITAQERKPEVQVVADGIRQGYGQLVIVKVFQCVQQQPRLLAASLRGRPVGLMVDEVFGQRHFVTEERKQARLPKNSPLKGFVHKQYRSGKDVWREFDLDTLFSTAEFLNGAAA